jgi:hypothetical protein
MNVVSFVDRDMVMRYFGGGIGHLKNAPPVQVLGFDPIDPSSEEMPVEDEDDDDPCSGTNEDLGTIVRQPSKDVVNGGELEDDMDDEDDEENDDNSDSDGDESGDQTDEDEDEEGDSEDDDYGYA